MIKYNKNQHAISIQYINHERFSFKSNSDFLFEEYNLYELTLTGDRGKEHIGTKVNFIIDEILENGAYSAFFCDLTTAKADLLMLAAALFECDEKLNGVVEEIPD